MKKRKKTALKKRSLLTGSLILLGVASIITVVSLGETESSDASQEKTFRKKKACVPVVEAQPVMPCQNQPKCAAPSYTRIEGGVSYYYF